MSSVLPYSHILHAPFSVGVQRQFSRYYNEFEELQLLGKGAFGAVIKVNPVDPSRTHTPEPSRTQSSLYKDRKSVV